MHTSQDFTWKVRVRGDTAKGAVAFARNQSFIIGKQASFNETEPHPSAVDYLLCALAGDLIIGFQNAATRRNLLVDALEARVTGTLNNPLVFLGVVGEEGHPGFEEIACTLYVSADANEPLLQQSWQETLARSPLVNTLKGSVKLTLQMQFIL